MDAKDAEPRDAAWEQVTQQFSALGERVRQRYEEQGGERAVDRSVEGAGESLQDALRTLSEAAERVATTVGDVIRDPQIQDDARRAASSLVDAFGLTFSRLGQDLRRPRGSDDEWDEQDPPPQLPTPLGGDDQRPR